MVEYRCHDFHDRVSGENGQTVMIFMTGAGGFSGKRHDFHDRTVMLFMTGFGFMRGLFRPLGLLDLVAGTGKS